jgi:hypothetical protein
MTYWANLAKKLTKYNVNKNKQIIYEKIESHQKWQDFGASHRAKSFQYQRDRTKPDGKKQINRISYQQQRSRTLY